MCFCGSHKPHKTRDRPIYGSCIFYGSHKPQMGLPCVFCGSHKPQIGRSCDFVVHINQKKHVIDLFVVHVFFMDHITRKWVHHVFFGSHKPQKTHGGGKRGLCAPQKYIWKGVAPVHVLFGGSHESQNDQKMAGKANLPSSHVPFTTPALNHLESTPLKPHLSCFVISGDVSSWLF